MTLDDNETIILYIRKHWILFWVQIFPIFLLAFPPIIFPTLFDFFLPQKLARFQNAGWALYFMWLIVLWIWGFLQWTEYYLDVWVLTSRKIINADQKSLFNRHLATLELEKIQDISVEVNGFIDTMFGYGTIRVQTAGETREFFLKYAYHPEDAKQEILDAQNRLREDILKRQSIYIRDGVGY